MDVAMTTEPFLETIGGRQEMASSGCPGHFRPWGPARRKWRCRPVQSSLQLPAQASFLLPSSHHTEPQK